MVRYVLGVLLCLLVLLTVGTCNVHLRVPISSVSTVVLRNDQMTTGRRVLPINQLECVGGDAMSQSYQVRSMMCTQTGHDGVDVTWSCTSNLNSDLELGPVEVMCEGYDYPNDPFILAGSCGARYTLHYSKNSKQPVSIPSTQSVTTVHTTETTYDRYGLPITFVNKPITNVDPMVIPVLGMLLLVLFVASIY